MAKKQTTMAVDTIGGKTEIGYYTAEGVEVTERIRTEQTKFFEDNQEADAYAEKNKTYKYDLFNKSGEFMGYGVPK